MIAVVSLLPGWVAAILAGASWQRGSFINGSRERVGVQGMAAERPSFAVQPRPFTERSFFARQNERYGSPFKACQFQRPMVCYVGLSPDWTCCANTTTISARRRFRSGVHPGGFMRHMPPDRHIATKEVFRKVIDASVYRRLEPWMRERVREAVLTMAEVSAASADGIRPRAHIQRLVFTLWGRACSLVWKLARRSLASSRDTIARSISVILRRQRCFR